MNYRKERNSHLIQQDITYKTLKHYIPAFSSSGSGSMNIVCFQWVGGFKGLVDNSYCSVRKQERNSQHTPCTHILYMPSVCKMNRSCNITGERKTSSHWSLQRDVPAQSWRRSSRLVRSASSRHRPTCWPAQTLTWTPDPWFCRCPNLIPVSTQI